ncbi:MAG TPA: amidohydrolase [Desulfobulbaceae bacterium]|nr:amidohydrolase [Desulfobulbaceae bacterium]
MAEYIDFHTHAFPDQIAPMAIQALEKKGNVKAYLDGTVDDLLSSMDRAGIERSVVCSIATRPEQFHPILNWSQSIKSERIIPLPSVHPRDPEAMAHLLEIKDQGFIGLKMHPYYQDFFLDDPELLDLYRRISELDLLLVMHTGYDIGYPRIQRADPERILNVVEKVPELRLITTHLGGWDEWTDVRNLLTGRPIYMEISFALDFLDQIRLRELIENHPPEFILFGTDSPWADQATTLKMLGKLGLDADLFNRIVRDNALQLLA